LKKIFKKKSINIGLNFAAISAVITTLGLMVGLQATTNSLLIVIGGILTIAIADSMSDALGIHVSQESQKYNSKKEIWESTLSTFFGKFFLTLIFVIPLLLFPLEVAVAFNIILGLGIVTIVSYLIAKNRQEKPVHLILEHIVITVIVILLTHSFGILLSMFLV
jgi:vacuolar iron transporter family protein